MNLILQNKSKNALRSLTDSCPVGKEYSMILTRESTVEAPLASREGLCDINSEYSLESLIKKSEKSGNDEVINIVAIFSKEMYLAPSHVSLRLFECDKSLE